MSLAFLMDVHVKAAVTEGLRRRELDVVTAQEDGSDRLSDAELLGRAQLLGRVLFTQDADLLREAKRRQSDGIEFAGVAFAHQQRVSTGECVERLNLMGEVYDSIDMQNRVEYLSRL